MLDVRDFWHRKVDLEMKYLAGAGRERHLYKDNSPTFLLAIVNGLLKWLAALAKV
jgi:hypothetical protein